MTAVSDPVAARAAIEAGRLGCEAVVGLSALVDRPDVDAVFLLGDPWFSDWPIAAALDRGKAVFAAGSRRSALGLLARRAEDGRDDPPLAIELETRFEPVITRLRELIAGELGPPRRVNVTAMVGGSVAEALVDLIAACRILFDADPSSSRRIDREGSRFACRGKLAYPCGGTGRLVVLGGSGIADPSIQLTVETERGRAFIGRQGTIRWESGSRRGEEPPGQRPLDAPSMADQFLGSLRGEPTDLPTRDELLRLERACRGLDPRL